MCVPLIGSENKVLGVLYVDNFMSAHQFGEADVDFAIAFAGIAAVAQEIPSAFIAPVLSLIGDRRRDLAHGGRLRQGRAGQRI